MSEFKLIHSIIGDCPALRLPQTSWQQLGMMAQIILLKGASSEIAQFIVDACNEKAQRDAAK